MYDPGQVLIPRHLIHKDLSGWNTSANLGENFSLLIIPIKCRKFVIDLGGPCS